MVESARASRLASRAPDRSRCDAGSGQEQLTLADEVRAAAARLGASGLPPDGIGSDAAVLARHALGWDAADWLCRLREPAPNAFRTRYAALLERRARREPVASIIGRREFWGLDFEVGPAVLTPRPETELLVAEALRIAAGWPGGAGHIVDAGSGSGCIAVALAAALPAARITATDISAATLAVARRNARRHGVEQRIAWVRTSWLDAIRATPNLIVANPPYVRDGDLPTLPPEVRDFEPRLALAGGPDGLREIRTLLAAAAGRLPARGHLLLEVGAGQAAATCAQAASGGRLAVTAIRRDLQQIERVVVLQRLPAAGE